MIEVVGRLPGKVRAGDELLVDALGAHLVGGLAEGQRLGLGEEVGQEQLVDVGARRRARAYAGRAKAMKSAGTSRVPWWMSW